MVKKNTYLVTYLHLLIRRQNKPEIWRIAVGLLRCQCQHCNSAPHKTLNTKLPDVDGSDEVTVRTGAKSEVVPWYSYDVGASLLIDKCLSLIWKRVVRLNILNATLHCQVTFDRTTIFPRLPSSALIPSNHSFHPFLLFLHFPSFPPSVFLVELYRVECDTIWLAIFIMRWKLTDSQHDLTTDIHYIIYCFIYM